MAKMRRTDLEKKALRAAAKVALLGAGFGCGTAPTDALRTTEVTSEPPPPDAGVASADASMGIDAGTVVVGDAGVLDSGLAMDAGAMDAGADFCDMGSLSTEDYLACCERIGWDWERGCAAWGPPAPPSFEPKGRA